MYVSCPLCGKIPDPAHGCRNIILSMDVLFVFHYVPHFVKSLLIHLGQKLHCQKRGGCFVLCVLMEFYKKAIVRVVPIDDFDGFGY